MGNVFVIVGVGELGLVGLGVDSEVEKGGKKGGG